MSDNIISYFPDEESDPAFCQQFDHFKLLERDYDRDQEVLNIWHENLQQYHDQFELPGRGEPKMDHNNHMVCGSINNQLVCHTGDHATLTRNYCMRYTCPVCFRVTLMRTALRIRDRIITLSKFNGINRIYHYTISPYKEFADWNFKDCYPLQKYFIFNTAQLYFFHPFRYVKAERTWRYSPHYHELTDSPFVNSERAFKDFNQKLVIKRLGNFAIDNFLGILLYELGHSGVDKRRSRQCMYRYSGDWAYNQYTRHEVTSKQIIHCNACAHAVTRRFDFQSIKRNIQRKRMGFAYDIVKQAPDALIEYRKVVNNYYTPSKYNKRKKKF